MIRRAGILVIMTAGGLAAFPAPASQRIVPSVRIAARIISSREAEITAQYRIPDSEQGVWSVSHLAMRIPGQSVEILGATARGQILPIVPTEQDGGLHLDLKLPDPGAREYEIKYRLRSEHNARLPLLVPMAGDGYSPTPGGCEIAVSLPDDWVSVGYEFPWFERLDGGLRAVLPDLPALLVIQGRRQSDVGVLDRLFTLDNLTNGGLLLLLIAASAYRFLLVRRGGGKAGAS